MDTLLVTTKLPDAETARRLARALVDGKLAACVSVLAPCVSIYRWQGAIEETDEVPLLIKTCRDRLEEVTATIRALHPYALPEVVALDIVGGLPAYLDWVVAETRPGA